MPVLGRTVSYRMSQTMASSVKYVEFPRIFCKELIHSNTYFAAYLRYIITDLIYLTTGF